MKKPSSYHHEEKQPLYISQQVLDKFRDELQKVRWDFEKLCIEFHAIRCDRAGQIHVYDYDNPGDYERFLGRHGLVDFDFMYDFTKPYRYFQLLLSKTKVPESAKPSHEALAKFREKLQAGGQVRTS